MTVIASSVSVSESAAFVNRIRTALEEPSADKATKEVVNAVMGRVSSLLRSYYPRGFPFELLSGTTTAPRPRLAKMNGVYMCVYNKFHHTIRISTAGEFDVAATTYVHEAIAEELSANKFDYFINVYRDRAALIVEIEHSDTGVAYMRNTEALNSMLEAFPQTMMHRRMLDARESIEVTDITSRISELQSQLSEEYARLGVVTAQKALASMPELRTEYDKITEAK